MFSEGGAICILYFMVVVTLFALMLSVANDDDVFFVCACECVFSRWGRTLKAGKTVWSFTCWKTCCSCSIYIHTIFVSSRNIKAKRVGWRAMSSVRSVGETSDSIRMTWEKWRMWIEQFLPMNLDISCLPVIFSNKFPWERNLSSATIRAVAIFTSGECEIAGHA